MEEVTRTNAHQWLATAYREAGHAVVILQLGHKLMWIDIESPSEGATCSKRCQERLLRLTEKATRTGRVSAELLRLWCDEFWVYDAGMIAEAEFNLVPPEHLASGGLGDAIRKVAILPDKQEHPFVRDYFHRHVGQWADALKDNCRQFFRIPHISAMTRTLAEALIRSKRMEGEEVIDTLLANQANVTGQMDLFWSSVDTRKNVSPHRL